MPAVTVIKVPKSVKYVNGGMQMSYGKANAAAVATTGGFGFPGGFASVWTWILVLFVLLAVVAAAGGFAGGYGY
jgi:hypothetical protein